MWTRLEFDIRSQISEGRLLLWVCYKPDGNTHAPLSTQLEPTEPRWPITTAGDLGHPAREVEYAVENAMTLSPAEIAQIRAEIKRLEEARDECNDGGIR